MASASPPLRVVLVTLDGHLAAAFTRARDALAREAPGLGFEVHVAAEWPGSRDAWNRCRADLEQAHIVIATMLFTEDTADPVAEVIRLHRDRYDAVACVMCAPGLTALTRLGRFDPGARSSASSWSPVSLLRRLRGRREVGKTPGERQLAMLRALPKLLRFVPGSAQDLRAFLLVMQYWLGASDVNLANLVRMLVHRYAAGPRAGYRRIEPQPPEVYPEVGGYHPDLPNRGMVERLSALPLARGRPRVGLLVGRSYLLAGNTAHYDAVIRALEARRLAPVACFAGGLDARPAIDRFCRDARGKAAVEALVSLTGFSLVGGPACNDPEAAQAALASLDVPYLSLQALEFQSVSEWERDPRGLNPLQATLQVAIPELDGAIGPQVFGGGSGPGGSVPLPDRVERVADRIARLVRLRTTPRAERRVAIVLFSFPPNAGTVGTAAYLAVFPSLRRVLGAMRDAGYQVEVPSGDDELRARLLEGNAASLGTPANVHVRIDRDEYLRSEPNLAEIEAVWGPAPGRQLTDGQSLFVMGAQFGNVFVGIQPAFGWEGDPMRLLFERGFAPTHAFAAFYRWIDRRFGAHAVLHFGTHGALEFMPGKQVGLSARCWPDRLIGDLPNVYLYAANNSSEGTLAKRRAGAALVSYLTPPITTAGLYRELLDLKHSIDRYRQLPPGDGEAPELESVIREEAVRLELAGAEAPITTIRERLLELEESLIPVGLHVLGDPMPPADRIETLVAMASAGGLEGELGSLLQAAGESPDRLRRAVELIVLKGDAAGARAALGTAEAGADAALAALVRAERHLAENREVEGLLRGLDGRYLAPVPGGDLLRNPAILPTGRNIYGFDPFRVPSAAAIREGQRRAELLVSRYRADHGRLPRAVACVLWGSDTMKSDGAPIGAVLALLGAAPRFDAVGRLAGARLLPLERLGRPRIDVMVTVSGIFRDLLPLQIRVLAEAAWLAATADEPLEMNPIRDHARQLALDGTFDPDLTGVRVFGNADGAYGSNVNLLIESGRWTDGDELADQFVARKSHGYRRQGPPVAAAGLYRRLAGLVDCAFQNLDSVELGATDIDQYVESLGGLHRVVERERGGRVPAYLTDHTRGAGVVRTVGEQIALEARTRTLNPRWYEAQLAYGYEGVRALAARVTTVLGWSATSSAVPGWVFDGMAATFVLDPVMRARLADANPTATSALASRLVEASDRGLWAPDPATLAALRDTEAALEDRLEGIVE